LKKNITITSQNKAKIFDNSILGILKDQKINEFQPIDLFIELGKRYSGFAFLLSITNKNTGDLEYSVECKDEEFKDAVKYEIDKWVENLRPHKINQIWLNKISMLIPVYITFLFFLFLFSLETPDRSYEKGLKAQADSLIAKGINKDNYIKAIEIILKLQADYNPKSEVRILRFTPRIIKIFIILSFCVIIIAINPETTIGIGKHKQKLKFHKFWNKFVLITLPSIIILPKIFSIISDWIF
jgi:hypothetical protein